jgi:hypothetical protein
MACLIEDDAVIGNCESAAMVGHNGSMDWLAVPSFLLLTARILQREHVHKSG